MSGIEGRGTSIRAFVAYRYNPTHSKRRNEWGTRNDNPQLPYNFTLLNLRALVITDTLLKLIAAAAMIGDKSMPNLG